MVGHGAGPGRAIHFGPERIAVTLPAADLFRVLGASAIPVALYEKPRTRLRNTMPNFLKRRRILSSRRIRMSSWTAGRRRAR